MLRIRQVIGKFFIELIATATISLSILFVATIALLLMNGMKYIKSSDFIGFEYFWIKVVIVTSPLIAAVRLVGEPRR